MLVYQLHCFPDMNLEGIAKPKENRTTGKLIDLGAALTKAKQNCRFRNFRMNNQYFFADSVNVWFGSGRGKL